MIDYSASKTTADKHDILAEYRRKGITLQSSNFIVIIWYTCKNDELVLLYLAFIS